MLIGEPDYARTPLSACQRQRHIGVRSKFIIDELLPIYMYNSCHWQFDSVRTGHWTEQKQAILLHAIPRRCRYRWHNALNRTELSKTFKDNFYIISACHDYGILYFVMQLLRSIPSSFSRHFLEYCLFGTSISRVSRSRWRLKRGRLPWKMSEKSHLWWNYLWYGLSHWTFDEKVKQFLQYLSVNNWKH